MLIPEQFEEQAKSDVVENYANDIQEFRTNKRATTLKWAEELKQITKDGDPSQRALYGIFNAVAETATNGGYPELQRAIAEDNIMQTANVIAGAAGTMARDAGLTMLSGGGYYAFVGIQSMNSAVSMYNNQKELQKLTGVESSPETYAAIDGLVNFFGGVLLGQVGGKIATHFTKKLWQQGAVWATVGGLENISQLTIETQIRNNAFEIAGQKPIDEKYTTLFGEDSSLSALPDVGWYKPNGWALLMAGTMGAGFHMARSFQYNKVKSGTSPKAKQAVDTNNAKIIQKKLGLSEAETGFFDDPNAEQVIFDNTPEWFGGREFRSSEDKVAFLRDINQAMKESFEGEVTVNPKEQTFLNLVDMEVKKSKWVDGGDISSSEDAYARQLYKTFSPSVLEPMMDDIKTQRLANVDAIEGSEGMTTFQKGDIMKSMSKDDARKYALFVEKNVGEASSAVEISENILKRLDEIGENWDAHTKEALSEVFTPEKVEAMFMNKDGSLRKTATIRAGKAIEEALEGAERYRLGKAYTDHINENILFGAEKIDFLSEVDGEMTSINKKTYKKLLNKLGRINKAFKDVTKQDVQARNTLEKIGNSLRDVGLWVRHKTYNRLNISLDKAYANSPDEAVRTALKQQKRNNNTMNKIHPDLTNNKNGFIEAQSAFIKKNNLVPERGRGYIDDFQRKIQFGEKVDMKTVYIQDNQIIDPSVKGSPKVRTGAIETLVSPELLAKHKPSGNELIYAFKETNHNEPYFKIAMALEKNEPIDMIAAAKALPSWEETPSYYIQGQEYHSRAYNAEGKAKIKTSNNIDYDDVLRSSIHEERSLSSSLFQHDEYRLSPLEEADQGKNRIINKIVYGQLNRDMNKTITAYMGVDKKNAVYDLQGMRAKKKEYDQLKINDPVLNELIEAKKFVSPENNDMLGIRRTPVLRTADDIVGFTGELSIKYLLSPFNSVYNFVANPVQSAFTLTPFVGAKMLKHAPKGWVHTAKMLATKLGNPTKYISSLEGKKSMSDSQRAFIKYATEEYSNSNIKRHYDAKSLGEPTLLLFNNEAKIRKGVDSIRKITDHAMIGMTTSDLSSRPPVFDAIFDTVDTTMKKFKGRKAGNSEQAVKFLRGIEEEFGIRTLPEIEADDLSKALRKGIVSGDMTEFKYKYAVAMTELGIFRYGQHNKHAITRGFSKLGKTGGMAGSLMSWSLYGAEITGKTVKDAARGIGQINAAVATEVSMKHMKDTFKSINQIKMGEVAIGAKNLRPAIYSLTMLGAGLKAWYWTEENLSKDNAFKRITQNYFSNRMPLARDFLAITSKTSNPAGFLSTVMAMYGYGLGTAKDLLLDENNKRRNPFKYMSPERLAKIPTTTDVRELQRALKRTLKDLESYAESSGITSMKKSMKDTSAMYSDAFDLDSIDDRIDAKIEDIDNKLDNLEDINIDDIDVNLD